MSEDKSTNPSDPRSRQGTPDTVSTSTDTSSETAGLGALFDIFLQMMAEIPVRRFFTGRIDYQCGKCHWGTVQPTERSSPQLMRRPVRTPNQSTRPSELLYTMSTTTFHLETDEPLSERVVRALAVHSDRPPEAIPPLAESIDPDAIDALFQGQSVSGGLTFRHGGYQITAYNDGEISLKPVN